MSEHPIVEFGRRINPIPNAVIVIVVGVMEIERRKIEVLSKAERVAIGGYGLPGECEKCIDDIACDCYGNLTVESSVKCPNGFIQQFAVIETWVRRTATNRNGCGNAIGEPVEKIPASPAAHRQARNVNAVRVDVHFHNRSVDHRHCVVEQRRIAPADVGLGSVEERATGLSGGQEAIDVIVDLARIVGAPFARAMQEHDQRSWFRRIGGIVVRNEQPTREEDIVSGIKIAVFLEQIRISGKNGTAEQEGRS